MRIPSYIISIIFLLSANACETEVNDVRIPEFEQKLVITAFLSPIDSVTYISVKSNRAIYGDGNRDLPVGKISGSISDGAKEVSLEPDSSGLILRRSRMNIEYGKTYHLKVQSDRGLSAEATCTVPQKRNFIIQADTISTLQNFEWSGNSRRYDLAITICDIAGEENYYRVEASVRGFSSNYFHQWTSQRLLVFDYLVSDKKLDGETFVRNTDSGINYFMNLDTSYATVYLYNTERSYYLYHKSLQDYHKIRGPFAEPTPVYSNIKGGLGIFTSYTIDSAVFRLK